MGAVAVERVAAERATLARKIQSPKNKARQVFRTVHLVLGLSFGLLLVAQGLSGAALVWRPELDRLMLPKLMQTAEGAAAGNALDTGFAAAKAAVPGGRVRAVRLPLAANGTDEWMVQMPAAPGTGEGKRLTVYTAPATGQVLGTRGNKRDALQFLIEIHHNLLWGKTGRTVQGYLALATVLLSLSGLWLWWPSRWTPSRFRPRAAAKPLHYALGFWAMWPLLAISVTATYFVWRQPMQGWFGVREQGAGNREQGERVGGSGERHGQAQGADGHAVSLDGVLVVARAAQPDARFTMLRLPESKDGAYTVMFESAAEHYRSAPNSLTVRAGADGGVHLERVSLWKDLPRAKRFLEWLPRVHQGEFGGIPVRLIWSLTGMMPAVLYVSGFLMWRRRLAADV